MIKRARSEELGSLEFFDGISRISFGCSVPSDIFRQSDNASWKRCLQALPTGQELEKLKKQLKKEFSEVGKH